MSDYFTEYVIVVTHPFFVYLGTKLVNPYSAATNEVIIEPFAILW